MIELNLESRTLGHLHTYSMNLNVITYLTQLPIFIHSNLAQKTKELGHHLFTTMTTTNSKASISPLYIHKLFQKQKIVVN